MASEEERHEFEKNCALYAEVLHARIAFELSLEQLARDHAVTPAPQVKGRVMEQIKTSASTAPVRKMNWLKYAAAACVILLAGSFYWNISMYNKNRKMQLEYDQTMAKLADMENEIRMVTNNPNMKMASLKGMESSPQSFATVYWDTTSHDVYLMLNNLPKPASDKQYQLWALLDGKPIDMGMIDNNYFISENKLLIRGRNIQHAQAFAITLEKKDRPDTSTPQGTMYVHGNL